LLARASRINAQIPADLAAYRARVESEMSLALIDSAGRERSGQIEEIASDVRWLARDRYDQRVVGYRSQAVGPMFSLMSIFGGWTTPTLYGNELQLGVTPSETAQRMPANATRTTLTVHPLANDRESFYRFSGGDTAVTLYSRGRRIPVVSAHVTPRDDLKGNAILFFGDIYIDADRAQLVRMRGRIVELKNGHMTLKSGSRIPGVSGASFVELENVEVNGKYWLPAYQRTEIQARIALFGDFRAVVRIVSRFHDYRINDSSWTIATTDTSATLSFARSDSLTRFHDWHRPLGAASTDVEYADFDDVAPESWRTSGSSSVRFKPRTVGDVFRFNRIEGAFTGLAAEHDFGAAGPGFAIRAAGGWAWSEKVFRGSLTAQKGTARSTIGVRAERALVNTNDFQPPLSGGATTPALLGSVDDFDYLDRRSFTLFGSRKLGPTRRSVLRLEVGPAADRKVEQHASRGLYVQGEGFRPNRGVIGGRYFHSIAALEINPQVSGLFVDRGIGVTLQYDRADGSLEWQRAELRVATRHEVGPFQVYGHANAGAVLTSPVPQVMFEIGRNEGLTAYGYKEFAGDRAATLDAVVGYTFPFLRAPMHLPEGLIAPGLAPGIAAGIHGAWTELSSIEARSALFVLGTRQDASGAQVPLSRSTDGARASAEFLVTFFSGALGIGVAKPIDYAGPWKITGRIGQGF
jgi:hypothetical protein